MGSSETSSEIHCLEEDADVWDKAGENPGHWREHHSQPSIWKQGSVWLWQSGAFYSLRLNCPHWIEFSSSFLILFFLSPVSRASLTSATSQHASKRRAVGFGSRIRGRRIPRYMTSRCRRRRRLLRLFTAWISSPRGSNFAVKKKPLSFSFCSCVSFSLSLVCRMCISLKNAKK